MSAFGGKADIKWHREKSPLLTQSGHHGATSAKVQLVPGELANRDSGR